MQVISIAGVRARRDNGRLKSLQVEFARVGLALDPLTEDSYLIQYFRLTRVLRSLGEAQQLLEQIRGEAS